MVTLGLGAGFPRRKKRGAPVNATALRVIETQGRAPSARSNNASNDRVAVRWPIMVAADASEAVLSFSNWYMDFYNILNNGNDVSIVTASLEAPNGTVVPVTFSGGRTLAIANGATDLKSDAISPSSFGYSQFSQNQIFWFKAVFNLGSVGGYTSNTTITASEVSGSQSVGFASSATTPSSTDTAGIYTASGTAFVNQQGPRPIMLGRPLSNGPSFMVVGDSIAEGHTYDTPGLYGIYGRGHVAKAMSNFGKNPYPMLMVAVAGARIELFNNYTQWTTLAKYARYALDQLGTNNISVDSLATLQTKLQSVWSSLAAQGVSRIYRTELLCNTTSTDSWATTANQTVAANWGAGEKVEQLHSWFATKVTDTTLYMSIPTNSLKDPTDSKKWRVSGSANFFAYDGVHPSPWGFFTLASELRAYLQPDYAADIRNIGGLRLWYDFSDTSTITASGGDVTAIVSKEGNGFAGSQANASKRPKTGTRTVNSLNTLDFDGTDDALALPNDLFTNTDTVAFYAYLPDTTLGNILANVGTGGGQNRFYLGNQYCDFGNTQMDADTKTSGVTHIQMSQVSAGTGSVGQRIRTNNTTKNGTVTRAATVQNQFYLGAYNDGISAQFNGALGEVAVWTRALSYYDKNIIGNYLERWGATWTDLTS